MFRILSPKPLLAAALAGLLAGPLPAGAAEFDLRLAHHYPDVHIQAGPLRAFVEEVQQNSQGRIAITVYPAETLVSGREVLEAVEGGVVDMAPMPGNYQSGSIPQLDYFTYPFMFDNAEHFRRAVDGGLRDLLVAEYARRGITLLNYYHKGALHFMHRSEFLATPAAFEGQRIRSLGPTISALITAMGGNALSVPLGEVDAAIERGVVDAITTNCAAHLSRGWSHGLPFVTFMDMSQGGEGLAINTEVFDGLPEDLQRVIRTAAQHMEDAEWTQMIHEDEEVCPQRWADAGVSVHRLTPEEREAFAAIARPILDEALSRNPEVQTYVDIAEATR
ncbi:MAG: TRAP transporter substrate-binding protein [Rhodobacteraceae bacterium]|nr:TRAP transporter substrate-binding protein [Paracoccaceae bacterium]